MAEISVIIPSYNHAAYIGKAVESVLSQTTRDLELLVVDDGSRDNSLQVLQGFQDTRMRVIAQSNQGADAAINRGIQKSCGRYLAILNSDDYYAPSRLEKALAAFARAPELSLLCTYIQVIDSTGQLLGIKHGYKDLEPWLLAHPERSFRAGDDLRAALLTENYCATTSNYIFSRAAFEQFGPFRPLRYAHDWDFALRATRVAALEVLPEPLVYYRIHAHNTIRENQAAMIFEICWILAVHLPLAMQSGPLAERPAEEWIDPLLHSVYTYQFDRVLAMLLAMNLAQDEALALQLLDPANPLRAQFISHIQEELSQTAQPATPTVHLRYPWIPMRLRRVLGRVKRAVLK
jgi:glycosyltransferase involved in cell wall biosynthesis